MLDKLRKQTFKHQGKYLSIKIWLPILEKTYFYTEKKFRWSKKRPELWWKVDHAKFPWISPWPNVKISIQDIFALLKPATKKNIFIERENKQANKR